jgi:RNA polymerase sigma-70 factor, ECF subfamily
MDAMMKSRERLEDLIKRAQAGDRKSLDALFEDHRPRLLAFIELRMGAGLRARVDAQDILQQTFLKAIQSIGKFQWQGEGSFMSWLSGIAGNVVLDLADPRRRKLPERLESDWPAPCASPSKALRRDERFERLREAIDALSPQHREVVLLARIEGLPVKEIAKRLNLTPNAVSQLLWRALQKLRDGFGDTESLNLPPRSLGGGRGEAEGASDDR